MERIIKLIAVVESLIPEYMASPEDKNISNGNVAICIIDADNNVFGKIMGTDKIRSRQS